MSICRRAVLIAVLVALAAAMAPDAATAAQPRDFPVQYMVKFVCGWAAPQPPGEEPPVKPGNYATAINVHNWTPRSVLGSVRVALHFRLGGGTPPALPARSLWSPRDRVVEVDCASIWTMANVPPSTFLKGMIHIGLPQPLPIAAVYTSQTVLDPQVPPDAGAGISIDVEQYDPFVNLLVPGLETP